MWIFGVVRKKYTSFKRLLKTKNSFRGSLAPTPTFNARNIQWKQKQIIGRNTMLSIHAHTFQKKGVLLTLQEIQHIPQICKGKPSSKVPAASYDLLVPWRVFKIYHCLRLPKDLFSLSQWTLKKKVWTLFSLLNMRHPQKFKPFSHWLSEFSLRQTKTRGRWRKRPHGLRPRLQSKLRNGLLGSKILRPRLHDVCPQDLFIKGPDRVPVKWGL